MIKIMRTNSDHPDFIALVKQLDILMAIVDGEDHAFYSQFNSLNKIKHVVLAHEDGLAPKPKQVALPPGAPPSVAPRKVKK